MLRIAGGKIAADGEAGNARGQFRQGFFQCREVELRLVAVDVVAAGDRKSPGSEPRAVLRPSLSRSVSEKPIITRPTRPPWPSTRALVARVVDIDTRRIALGVDAGQRDDAVGGYGDADGEVVTRRQRLRLGDDAALLTEEHGVGIGAARIETEIERRVVRSGHGDRPM